MKINNITAAQLEQAYTFGDVVTMGSGGKFVPLNGPEPLYVQLPALTAPFGVSQYGDTGKLTIPMNLDPETAGGLSELDSFARDAIKAHPAWVGKRSVSDDVLDVLYTPLRKPAANPRYSDTTKISLKFREDGEHEVADFRHDGIQTGPYTKGRYAKHQISSIIQVTGIWAAGAKCGLTTRLIRMKIEEPLPEAAAPVHHVPDVDFEA